MAPFVYAFAPASEFAMVILPNGCLPITQGRSLGLNCGSHNVVYSYA